jgi:recombination protein RecT
MTNESTAVTPYQQFETVLAEHHKKIESVLPEGMSMARLCRMAMNAALVNPTLLDCDPTSFLLAVINCGETGLEPTLGQAALVPRRIRGILRVCFEPMYGGLITLGHNTGFISSIDAGAVREGDEFEWELGTSAFLKHKPEDNSTEKLTHAYAICHFRLGGQPKFVVLNRLQVLKRKAVSKQASKQGSIWEKWEEEQWKKTAIKALAKYLPKSPQFQRAVMLDNLLAANKTQVPAMADISDLPVDLEPEGDDPEEAPDPERKPWNPAEGEAAPGEEPTSGAGDGLEEIM